MRLTRQEHAVLSALEANPRDARELAAELGLGSSGEVIRLAGGLERHGLVSVESTALSTFSLTHEGLGYQRDGLPERRALAILGDGLSMGDFMNAMPDAKVAVGWLRKKGWVEMAKTDAGTLLVPQGDAPLGADEKLLEALSEAPASIEDAAMDQLRSRGLVNEHQSRAHTLALTAEGKLALQDAEVVDDVGQITPEWLAAYEAMVPEERAAIHIRPFDFDVPVAAVEPGRPHPLTSIMREARSIFWRMGFQEISGNYVESAFWNMDALFIPQDHPAREMQDTFYLENPATLPVAKADLARGKAVHETGGDTGSTGWGGAFSADVSKQALLRTHTTNTTIRYLADHPEGAHKVFGLGRVFRKETMDATHLPEFHQIEGIVTEEGASFDMLVGLCRHFFTAMGFPEVRFRPAYFPYTEPSMEIDVKYRGKWMELGGCGVFRPEVTKPIGVEHPVLAWGFGLERLAMMRLGLKDIRQLYIPDLNWLKSAKL